MPIYLQVHVVNLFRHGYTVSGSSVISHYVQKGGEFLHIDFAFP